ncbi:heme o synthase [Luteolibacter sp. AS25]|uniref:heme o synthase n=1 Tax=Luteolibacter sp. AS25 TaxID=3135776 RepID=UPI00398B9367
MAFLAGQDRINGYGAGVAEEEEKLDEILKPPTLSQDLTVLMKVRLNFFVLVTTFFGYLLARKGLSMDWMILVHTLIGTAAAAFGSAAFNQLMEIDLDLLMKRTADRPLPSRRMSPVTAFGVGWILSAVGIIHLAVMVGQEAAYLTAATVAIYVFVYTPMKRMSSTNTLVGAIPGAIPPVIGWVAGGGGVLDPEAWFLFGILAFWQLPHFVAINWLCRQEYEDAGYKMWSNGDVSGKKSGVLSALFAVALAAFSLLPAIWGFANVLWLIVGPIFGLLIAALALRFIKDGERKSCRQLFFSTLIYLPVALTVLLIAWRR